MKINFIRYEKETGNAYYDVVTSIIEPIAAHLKPHTYIISPGYLDDKKYLNVRFFNEPSKEINSAKTVFIPHGIADKGNRDAKKVRGLKAVFVSGPAWKRKLTRQGLDPGIIRVNGWPKLDPLFNRPVKRQTAGKIRILFAPTHTRSKVTIFHKMDDILKQFDSSYEVVVSPHPFDWQRIYKNEVIPTYLQLPKVDAVITEHSSIFYEAWSLGIPVIFPDWLVRDKLLGYLAGDSFTRKVYERSLGYHVKSAEELLEKVQHAVTAGVDDNVREFMEGIFPAKLRGRSGLVTARHLLKLCKEEI
ncbi:CDP-glycerol glycerophosphotransferase family protein [Dethiobacter alkaliphilus]|uniref:CDP-glycerol glycerophosphotransferase family protein n=1 Tax=Dethiobacter alkaliphilus TaxID=427926 RepID=UPI0022266609|nr:CDP-glycerol glycerophosphotransferase family protein [Dethiobacter alkaliphilus]MCW3489258.1 CDP-glycerol glycerophosphotransferase family protein [Dethiobacter alkaliphilus]